MRKVNSFSRLVSFASAIVVATLVSSASALPVTFFDSSGFEPNAPAPYPWAYGTTGLAGLPRHVTPNTFTAASPANQQWVGQYQTQTTASSDNETDGAAIIQTAVVRNGNQALQVTRNASTGTQRYFYAQPTQSVTDTGVNAPATPLRFVTVGFDMRVEAPTPSGVVGPFFGIEAKGFVSGDLGNQAGSTPYRMGALGVNAGTQEVIVLGRATPGGSIEQFAIADADPIAPGNQAFEVAYGTNPAGTDNWYKFRMIFDYQNGTFDVGFETSPGNVSIIQTGIYWAEAGAVANITRFGDADIIGSALLTGSNTLESSAGRAWFDDVFVTAVPEPTVLATIGGVAVLALRRRSRAK